MNRTECLIIVLHMSNMNNEMSKSNVILLLLNMDNDSIGTWLKSKYIEIIININHEMTKSNIWFIRIQNLSVIVHVCFVLFIICFHICVCECLFQNNNHKTKHKNNTICGSASEPVASGILYYCTSICVCVPVVIGVLAVWISNPKKNNLR